ncbi:MAG: single-stranded DNA-binding protein [Solirubrobacteraceae bacterium]
MSARTQAGAVAFLPGSLAPYLLGDRGWLPAPDCAQPGGWLQGRALPSPRPQARLRQPPAGALFGLSTTPELRQGGNQDELGESRCAFDERTGRAQHHRRYPGREPATRGAPPRRDGEDQGADYVDVVAFGRQAETCAQYLTKGRRVAVNGRLAHS